MGVFLLLLLLQFTEGARWNEGVDLVEILPSETDKSIDGWPHPHVICKASFVPTLPWLLVHLPASHSSPKEEALILQEGALLGFLGIGLNYPNEWDIKSLCLEDSRCYGSVRNEIQYGVDSSDKISVNVANSLGNRLVKVLLYLNSTASFGVKWSAFLDCSDGCSVRWDRVVLSGTLFGASQAAFIAKDSEVARVAMLSAPVDYVADQAPVEWEFSHRATPANRHFGFVHTRQETCQAAVRAWSVFGMGTFGNIADAPSREYPFVNTHQLCTSENPAIGYEFGESIGIDRTTPKSSNGESVYAPVWRYMITPGNCSSTEDCTSPNSTCLSNGICFDGPFFLGTECKCAPCIRENYERIWAVMFVGIAIVSTIDILSLLFIRKKGLHDVAMGLLLVFSVIANVLFCSMITNLFQFGWGSSRFGSLCDEKPGHIIGTSFGILLAWQGFKIGLVVWGACCYLFRRKKKRRNGAKYETLKTEDTAASLPEKTDAL